MTLFAHSMLLLGTVPAVQGGAATVRVAVVHVPHVSEKYARTEDLEAQFEQKRLKLNEKRESLRAQVDRTKRSLQEEFKPGTREFEERSKQLALLETELQWFTEVESQKIEAGLAQSLRSIYNDIHAAIGEVARLHEIDIVLAADQLPTEPPGNTTQARQQIVLQKVLYWHPRVDLTDAVVAHLNEKYEAGKGDAPGGASQPPAVPKDPH